jgi:hypothetical protein
MAGNTAGHLTNVASGSVTNAGTPLAPTATASGRRGHPPGLSARRAAAVDRTHGRQWIAGATWARPGSREAMLLPARARSSTERIHLRREQGRTLDEAQPSSSRAGSNPRRSATIFVASRVGPSTKRNDLRARQGRTPDGAQRSSSGRPSDPRRNATIFVRPSARPSREPASKHLSCAYALYTPGMLLSCDSIGSEGSS